MCGILPLQSGKLLRRNPWTGLLNKNRTGDLLTVGKKMDLPKNDALFPKNQRYEPEETKWICRWFTANLYSTCSSPPSLWQITHCMYVFWLNYRFFFTGPPGKMCLDCPPPRIGLEWPPLKFSKCWNHIHFALHLKRFHHHYVGGHSGTLTFFLFKSVTYRPTLSK